MNKKDLKFGMVVELKKGTLCLIEPAANCSNVSINDYLTTERERNVRFRNIKTTEWETTLDNFNLDLTHNVDEYSIRCVYEDFTLNKRLWVCKEPLLTPEERDWLAAVIKPFRDKVCYIKLLGNNHHDNFIRVNLNDDSLSLPYNKGLPFKFEGLNYAEPYTLDELGL